MLVFLFEIKFLYLMLFLDFVFGVIFKYYKVDLYVRILLLFLDLYLVKK